MKALFVTFPAPSHYFPMVPLGWAIRSAGHEVRVACPPSFTGVVTRSGLPAVATGPEPDLSAAWRTAPEPGKPAARDRADRAMAMFTSAAAQTAGQVIEFGRWWRPDIVVYEPRAYAGLIAAGALGVPLVRHLYGTDYTYTRARHERAALEQFQRRSAAGECDPLGALTIDPCPPCLQVPGPIARQRIRYVPYNGPGICPSWLARQNQDQARDGSPRVCVTWGITHSRSAGGLATARAAIAALAGLEAQIVAVLPTGGAGLLGPVPGNVRVAESLPLHLVLPSCDVIIHQGGAGTTMTAACCGTPQLLLPDVADRMLNASRIAAVGAGLAVGDPREIRDAAMAILGDPSYLGAARALAARIACQPALAEAVRVLAGLGGRR